MVELGALEVLVLPAVVVDAELLSGDARLYSG